MLIFVRLNISINLMSFHHLRILSSLPEMSPCMCENRLVKWFNHGDGTLTSGLLNEVIFDFSRLMLPVQKKKKRRAQYRKSLPMLLHSVITLSPCPPYACLCQRVRVRRKWGCSGSKNSFLLLGVGQKSVSFAKAHCIVWRFCVFFCFFFLIMRHAHRNKHTHVQLHPHNGLFWK